MAETDPRDLTVLRRQADQAAAEMEEHLLRQDMELEQWKRQMIAELEAVRAAVKAAVETALKGKNLLTPKETMWVKRGAAQVPDMAPVGKLIGFIPLFTKVAQERLATETAAIERATHLTTQLETLKRGVWVIISAVATVGALVVSGALYIHNAISLLDFGGVIICIMVLGVAGVMVLNSMSARLGRRITKGVQP